MSKYRTKLPRMNNGCCEQVMPVPVIPICAISCSIPVPIVRVNDIPNGVPYSGQVVQNYPELPNRSGCPPCNTC